MVPAPGSDEHSISAFQPAVPVPVNTLEAELLKRTKVPPNRVEEILAWTPQRVRREARSMSATLKRFAHAVVASMDDPPAADVFLRTLDLRVISRDHDWRKLFEAMRRGEVEQQPRRLLVKYLQYLSFRKELLDYIQTRQKGLETTEEFSAAKELELPLPARAQRKAVTNGGREFTRLPIGEPVDCTLHDGQQIEIMLARHRFRLVGGKPPCFVDQNGVMFFLRRGRNMVGRHPETEITVNPDFIDVSRAHLVMDWEPEGLFRLMDISTRGTFMFTEQKVEAENSASRRPCRAVAGLCDWWAP